MEINIQKCTFITVLLLTSPANYYIKDISGVFLSHLFNCPTPILQSTHKTFSIRTNASSKLYTNHDYVHLGTVREYIYIIKPVNDHGSLQFK